MPRYIDANILMQDIDERGADFWCSSVDICNAKKIVSEQPTADVQEMRHGEWLGDMCSMCGGDALEDSDEAETYGTIHSNYCPHCGAKMDGEK